MRQSLDRPLADIFVACVDYYLANAHDRRRKKPGELHRHLQMTLTAGLKAMAAIHAEKYSGWKADRDHPGYLIKFEPPMLFRVPYHILPSFPTGHELESLWRLSRAIRSGDRSVISISGSNVMRKIFDIVGDVDFCEYLPISDANGLGRIAANMDGDNRMACVRLVLIDRKWRVIKEWRYPWSADRPSKDFFSDELSSSDEDRSMMKVDYGNYKRCYRSR